MGLHEFLRNIFKLIEKYPHNTLAVGNYYAHNCPNDRDTYLVKAPDRQIKNISYSFEYEIGQFLHL
jgi:hypothetical protein